MQKIPFVDLPSTTTPLSASNLNLLQDNVEDAIEEVTNVELLATSDIAPSTCATGDKYFNTTTKKIYTATSTNTWGSTGVDPIEGIFYIVFDEQSSYAYNGTTLVSVGGGKEDIVISDTEPTDPDVKLWIDTGEVQNLGSEVHIGDTINSKIGLNILIGKNICDGIFESGNIDDSGVEQTSTTTYRSVNYYEVTGGKTYVASYTAVGSTKLNWVACYDSNKTFITRLTEVVTTPFTLGNNVKYIRVGFYRSGGISASDFSNVQIELGSTPTTYQPYITPSINVENREIYSQPTLLEANALSINVASGSVINLNDYSITATRSGLALVTLNGVFDTNATGYRLLNIALNGESANVSVSAPGNSVRSVALFTAKAFYLNKGDVVAPRVSQTSGSTLNCTFRMQVIYL